MFAFSHSKTANSFIILLVLHYFRCFVSTNGMIIGLHVPNNLQMYRLNSEKHWGRGVVAAPSNNASFCPFLCLYNNNAFICR